MEDNENNMSQKTFGYPCCPPQPPHCSHMDVTPHDWVHYINSYIDVRARQIYDKLKGLGGGSGDTNLIEKITVNGIAQQIVNKVVDIPVPTDADDLPFDITKPAISTKDEIDELKTHLMADCIILRDQHNGKNYKLYLYDGTFRTEEYEG